MRADFPTIFIMLVMIVTPLQLSISGVAPNAPIPYGSEDANVVNGLPALSTRYPGSILNGEEVEITLHVLAVACPTNADSVGSGVADPYVRAAVGMDWNKSSVYPESMAQRYGGYDVYFINWEHTWTVTPDNPYVLIILQLWDDDSSSDDHIDIDPNGGYDLEIYYDLYTGTWSGDTSSSSSHGEAAPYPGAVWFYVTSNAHAGNMGYLNTDPMILWDQDSSYTIGAFNLDEWTLPFTLSTEENITLTLQPPSGADYDLFILSGGTTVVSSREPPGVTERITTTLPAGDYTILVKAITGQGVFQLSVDDQWIFYTETEYVDVSASGAYVHRQSQLITTVRMLGFHANIHITSSAEDGMALVMLTNLDPDMFVIDNYWRDFGLRKGENSVLLAVYVNGNADINIFPFFEEEEFYIVVIGDSQPPYTGSPLLPGGQIEQPEVFYRIMEAVSTINPPIVIDNGDLVDGLGTMDIYMGYQSPVQDEQYYTFLDPIKPRTGFIATTVGNHDVSRGGSDEWEHDGEEIYMDFLGPLWYSFDYGNTHFVLLDSYQDENHWWWLPDGTRTWGGYIKGEQYSWMAQDLNSTAHMRQIVTSHIPIVPPEPIDENSVNDGFNDFQNRVDVLKMYLMNNVSLMFASHIHKFSHYYIGLDINETGAEYATRKNEPSPGFIETLLTGGGGGQLDDPDIGHHFLLVKVSPAGVDYLIMAPDKVNLSYTISGPNDGIQELAYVNITNAGEYIIPQTRVKLKMNPGHAFYKATDTESGEELTVHCHRTEFYTAVYVDIDTNPGEVRSIKITPAEGVDDITVTDIAPFVSGKEYPGGYYTPTVYIKNQGEVDAYNVEVRVTVSDGQKGIYDGFARMSGPIKPGIEVPCTLGTDMHLLNQGDYTITAVLNYGDDCPGNNIMEESFSVEYIADAAVVGASFTNGTRIVPGLKHVSVTVENTGTVPIQPTVYFRAYYNSSETPADTGESTCPAALLPGEECTVIVGEVWTAYDQGWWRLEVGVTAEGDSNQSNNVRILDVLVDKAPRVYDLNVEPHITKAEITFMTDEPTRCTVFYGESVNLGMNTSEVDFAEEHHIVIEGLEPFTSYLFSVRADDLQGNHSIADNGGMLYGFTTLPMENRPPFVSNVRITPTEGFLGQRYTVTATVSDEDSDPIQYVFLVIDGRIYEMEDVDKWDTETIDGKDYQTSLLLDTLPEDIYIAVSDWTVETEFRNITLPELYKIDVYDSGWYHLAVAHPAADGGSVNVALEDPDNYPDEPLAVFSIDSGFSNTLWINATVWAITDVENLSSAALYRFEDDVWEEVNSYTISSNGTISLNGTEGVYGVFINQSPVTNHPPEILEFHVWVPYGGVYKMNATVYDDKGPLIAEVNISGTSYRLNFVNRSGDTYRFSLSIPIPWEVDNITLSASDGEFTTYAYWESRDNGSSEEEGESSASSGENSAISVLLLAAVLVMAIVAVSIYIYKRKASQESAGTLRADESPEADENVIEEPEKGVWPPTLPGEGEIPSSEAFVVEMEIPLEKLENSKDSDLYIDDEYLKDSGL